MLVECGQNIERLGPAPEAHGRQYAVTIADDDLIGRLTGGAIGRDRLFARDRLHRAPELGQLLPGGNRTAAAIVGARTRFQRQTVTDVRCAPS